MTKATHTTSKTPHKKQPKASHKKTKHSQPKISSPQRRVSPSDLKIAIISILLTAIIIIPSIFISRSPSTQPVTLSPAYYLNSSSHIDDSTLSNGATAFFDLNSVAYEQLIQNRESFVVMVDNPGCVTTARMREYLTSFQNELPFTYYRIMWSEVQKSSLKDTVAYFPSLVIIRNGTPVYHLRADSDEDAPYYNDADALKSWLESHITFPSS